jgi:hypothetical protein
MKIDGGCVFKVYYLLLSGIYSMWARHKSEHWPPEGIYFYIAMASKPELRHRPDVVGGFFSTVDSSCYSRF